MALLWVLMCALAMTRQHAAAWPSEWVGKHAAACSQHPDKAFGGHGKPMMDSATTFAFSDPNSKAPVKAFCPGGTYTVLAKFPEKRLALLTVSAGTIGSDKKCTTRNYSGGKQFDGFGTNWTAPCEAAGKTVDFKITSASSAKDYYHQATASADVGYTDGACAAVSKKANCKPVPTPKVLPKPLPKPLGAAKGTAAKAGAAAASARKAAPVKISVKPDSSIPISVLGGQPHGGGAGPSMLADNADLRLNPKAGDKLLLAPAVKGARARGALLALHGALMLVAFMLLLPLGALVARHRWAFGRDPRTGKVLSSWVWVHIAVQLLAILCGAAGIALAVVGGGFKRIASVPLYEPHKWLGVASLAAAALQLAAAMLRPPGGGKRRAAFEAAHRVWGRVTVAAGVANAFIGTVLVHTYKGHPLAWWLAPAAACAGAVLLAAAALEALRLQMMRTHRYDPKTDEMTDVFDAFHHSTKPAAAGAAGKVNFEPVKV